MKNTKNGVEAFVEERGKKDKKKSLSMMPTSQPSAPVGEKTNSVASHSQGSNNIIAYIKQQLKPQEERNVLTEEQKKKLNEYGIKTIEYDENNLSENLENIDKENKIYFQSSNQNIDDDINQRTDKTKYLTNNEVKQLENDKNNFQTYVGKLIKGELSPLTQLRVLKKLTSAYNNIPELKNKKVVITQDVYKKIIDLPNKFNKNHNVDRKRAIKLPELIADPLYILKSHSEGNEHRFVIVTSSKNNIPGEKLSVFLNPKNSVAVVSAYDENINISEEKKTGRVLYDKKKELSKTLAASKTVTIDNSNNSIADNQQNFNPQNEKRFYQSANEQTNDEKEFYNLNGSKVQNALNPLDYDYLVNIVTGEKIKIEMNEDIKVDKIQPQKISSGLPFEISQKTAINRKLIVDNLGLVQGHKIQSKNNYTEEIAIINKDTIKKSISNFNKSINYKDFISILYNIETLYKNSQKILTYKDAKQDTSTIIKRYANVAKINGKNYLIEFTLKDKGEIELYSLNTINNKTVSNKHLSQKGSALDTAENSNNKNLFNILNADVYDVIIDKKMPTSAHSPVIQQGSLMKPTSDNSITDNSGSFNPQQITIEEMLKNVVDADGNVYFQTENIDKENKIYFQNTNEQTNANKEYYNLDGTKVKDVLNPLDYDYIYTQFKNIPEEQQEKVKIEINPELENRKDEIVNPVKIKKQKLTYKSGKKVDVQTAIKEKLFAYKNGKPISIEVTNNKTNKSAIVNASTIDESTKELLNNVDKDFIGSILLNTKEIFKNSELILVNQEAKNKNLKGLQTVYRYALPIEYDGQTYVVISTVFDNKRNHQIKIYHLTGYKNSSADAGNQNASRSYTTNISIAQLRDFVKSRLVEKYNKDYQHAVKNTNKYYQESNEEEKLIAGYSYQEVMDKMSSLYDELAEIDGQEEQETLILAKIHILEEAFEMSENPDKYSTTQISDTMLNAYYVMNDQQIPEDYLETDKQSAKTYKDLLDAHNEKKAKKEIEFYGYFTEEQDKNIITIMQTHNASTALHELGHLFLNGLNELAKTSEEALKFAIYLNDKYAFDAQSANGYTGILWSIGGLHDRAFCDNPVTGKIRRMTYNSVKRKYDLSDYLQKYSIRNS